MCVWEEGLVSWDPGAWAVCGQGFGVAWVRLSLDYSEVFRESDDGGFSFFP